MNCRKDLQSVFASLQNLHLPRQLLVACLSLCLLMCGCQKADPKSSPNASDKSAQVQQTSPAKETKTKEPETSKTQPDQSPDKEESAAKPDQDDEALQPKQAQAAQPASSAPLERPNVDSSLLKASGYTGQPYIVLNNNQPYFSEEEISTQSYENYGLPDALNRCTTAIASLGLDLMPTSKRESISEVHPTGWESNASYSFIDGEKLYNRCHLIGFQLAGENANPLNLVTGTRYMNVSGMLPFENMVADYIKETGNHVMYRVTPVFENEDEVCQGVIMDAWSVEDQGEGICFSVFCYNVQPGVDIDYTTGANQLHEADLNSKDGLEAEEMPVSDPTVPDPQGTPERADYPEGDENSVQHAYVLNTRSFKFHKPDCKGVKDMSAKNRQDFSGTREEVLSMGYDPCGICRP